MKTERVGERLWEKAGRNLIILQKYLCANQQARTKPTKNESTWSSGAWDR